MNSTIQIITGIAETGVIGFVVYMIMKGLKTEIITLQKHISTQNETIKTMDKRIQETEKIGDLYKQLVSDFPQALEDYQTVITKTKDKTIYELKSQLAEHELTIGDLTKQTKSSDPTIIRKVAAISKFILEKNNKDLLEFLQKIETKSEIILEALIRSRDFDDLMNILNQVIEIDMEFDPREILGSEFMMKHKVKTVTLGRNGFYLITFDNKIYITAELLTNFKENYNSLK